MPNSAPVVTPINKTLFINSFINASDLFSVFDIDGDEITKYRFMDFNDHSSTGYFELNGVNRFNGDVTQIAASQLGNLLYVGGSAVSHERIRIQAFDGQVWSDPAVVAMAYTTRQNITRPIATVEAFSVLGNEYVNANTFISAYDPDGFPILKYLVRDRTVNNSFFRLGSTVLEQGVYNTIQADQLDDLRYYAFGRGLEPIDVFAYDGSQYSNFASALGTTRLNENRPVVQFASYIAPERQIVSLIDRISVTDADGNLVKRYRLIDTSPHGFSGYLTKDGVPLQAQQWHELLSKDLGRFSYVGANRVFSEQIRVRAYDGRFWSPVQSIVFDTVTRPKVGGPNNVIDAHLEEVEMGEVFFQIDNGPDFLSYEILDANTDAGSGRLLKNGFGLGQGQIHTVTVGELANDLVFETGIFGDRQLDEVYARAYNGTFFSEWRRVKFRTEPEYIASMFSGADWYGKGGIVGPIFPTGEKIEISYSFMQQFPDYETGEAVDEPFNDPPRPFSQFTATQRQAVRRMFRDIESFLNVEYVEVSDTSIQQDTGYRGGVMRFGNYFIEFDASITSAFAFLPGNLPESGDIWFNRFYNPAVGPAWSYGGGSYTTLLHETGHAMGLLHPFVGPGGGNQKPVLPEETDSDQYTLMSYTGSPNGLSPWNHQLYDIVGLQEVYGANETYAAGDDVYGLDRFGGNQSFTWNIWDTDGDDTITAEGSFNNSVVDLRSGGFSSIGSAADNLAITFGTLIENGIGSDHNDDLFGNELINILDGGLGNDYIRGGGGDDKIAGKGGNDTFEWGIADGSDRLNEDRGAGVDTILISPFPTVDDFTEDLSFRREGRDLVVDLTVDEGPSQGTFTVENQLWGAYRVESIEFGAIRVDLKELFAQVGPTNTQFRVLADSTQFGFLSVPI